MNLKTIFLPILLISLAAVGCNKVKPIKPTATGTVSPSVIALTQTYTNTKYRYSFKYPEGYKLESSNETGFPAPATNSTGEINIIKDMTTNQIFSIDSTLNLYPSFSEQGIENYFGKNKNVVITPINILGNSGYKITSNGNDRSIISDFYFVQNKTGVTVMITIAQGNVVSQQIFNSFKFTQ